MSDQQVDKLIVENYGAKNLSKVKRNMRDGVAESRRRFAEKYPGADFGKFEYQVDLDANGDINKYVVFYKVDDVSSYDITSNTFLNNRKWVWYLYQWERVWGSHGTVQDLKHIPDPFPYEINKFDIYVTDSSFFTADFPKLNTSWNDEKNSGKYVAVNTLKFDYENNPYFASVLAMYLVTYSCGISLEHLKNSPNTPRITTSLARYHIYYHISRFLRNPAIMTKYASSELLRKLSGSLQTDEIPVNLFYQFSGGAPCSEYTRMAQ